MMSCENLYFNLFKDCLIVKGASKSLLMDLTREEFFEFPSFFYDILKELETKNYMTVIIENTDLKDEIENFTTYLEENEFGHFISENTLFPSIKNYYTDSLLVRNSIIEVDKKMSVEALLKLILELDDLGCKHIELRIIDSLNLSHLSDNLHNVKIRNLNSINTIVKYESSMSDEEYIDVLHKTPIISTIFIHSSFKQEIISKSIGYGDIGNRQLIHTTQQITSNKDCGNINIESFLKLNITQVLMNQNCNSCLYKKVSIDSEGNIKNCPSMSKSYGNVKSNSLKDIVINQEFNKLGLITKDEITICSDCHYRYICYDCRAFIESPDDYYSKPLKCGYDPYQDVWYDWKNSVKNKNVIKQYNF